MAVGKVNSTNPPENAGKIKANINGQEEEFVYNVKAGHTKDGYTPKVGDDVNFTPGGSNVATGIEKLVTKDPTCRLSGPSQPVPAGTRVTLTYETFNATRAVFDNGIGEVPVGQGSILYTVTGDVRITLTVSNNSGQSESTTITIFVS
ncbi:MAG TPA: hypothetical protein VD905_18735 [Flavobacteriales bacterium]|nr:hypothetical protein [Flavobacteriales bacterium]